MPPEKEVNKRRHAIWIIKIDWIFFLIFNMFQVCHCDRFLFCLLVLSGLCLQHLRCKPSRLRLCVIISTCWDWKPSFCTFIIWMPFKMSLVHWNFNLHGGDGVSHFAWSSQSCGGICSPWPGMSVAAIARIFASSWIFNCWWVLDATFWIFRIRPFSHGIEFQTFTMVLSLKTETQDVEKETTNLPECSHVNHFCETFFQQSYRFFPCDLTSVNFGARNGVECGVWRLQHGV